MSGFSQSENIQPKRLGNKSKPQIIKERMEELKNIITDLSKELQQLKLRINPFVPVATDIYSRPAHINTG